MHSELRRRGIRRMRRSLRVRKGVRGTAEKPRLSVFKSQCHLYAQLIDDERAHTLACAGTMVKELREKGVSRKSKEAAKQLGQALAEKAKAQNIGKAVFDRGSAKFHGLLAELARAAREGGLTV